ncbi:MAG: hypothetical protein ACOX1F_00120 [Erysipelotrichaceae bacterium]|jgi:hypothetical protein
MDIEKTKKYYDNLKFEEICDCAYCKNYVREIKKTYPELAEYLASIGIDIEKPFETMPLKPENSFIEYIGVQYIIMGDKKAFNKTTVSDVQADIAKSHPATEIKDEHFVIEIYPITLRWTM